MKTAVALTLISFAAITAPAAGQDPRKAADAAVSAAVSRLDNHDREIAALKSRLAALEAQPRAPQPVPAAAIPAAPAVTASYPAPAGDGWRWAGSHWTRPMPGTEAPAFATPIRDAIYNLAAPSGCANGQCPTPRRR